MALNPSNNSNFEHLALKGLITSYRQRKNTGLHIVDDASCRARADVVFVVDSSGSINEHDKGNWDRVKNFAKSIVRKLDIGRDRIRVGMVEFGNEGSVHFYLNQHYNIPDMTEDIDRSLTLGVNSVTAARY